jgi:hypothetical protein
MSKTPLFQAIVILLLIVYAFPAAPQGGQPQLSEMGLYTSSDLGTSRPKALAASPGSPRAALLQGIGGVVLQGKVAENRSIQLRYNGSEKALEIAAQNGVIARLDVPLWRLDPLVAIVQSESTAMATIADEPTREEKYAPLFSNLEHDTSRKFFINVHPALRDRLLGMHMIMADIILVDTFTRPSVEWVKAIQNALARQFPQKVHPCSQSESETELHSNAILRELVPPNSSTYVLNDFTVNYSIDDQTVKGTPVYSFYTVTQIFDAKPGETPELDPVTNGRGTIPITKLRTLCAPLIDSFVNSARTLAVLRYVKDRHTSEWNKFLKQRPDTSPIDTIETPRVWIPQAWTPSEASEQP